MELDELKKHLGLLVNSDAPEYDYNCEVCKDSSWTMSEVGGCRLAKRCDCFNNSLIISNKEKLTDILGKHTIKSLKDLQKKIVAGMKLAGQQSCWLSGKSGLGKSALVFYWLSKKPESMLVTKGSSIENLFRIQTENGYKKANVNFNQYKFVVIDDIDKRWPFTESVKNGIYEVLDEIVRSECILLITANMTLEKFCSAFPEHQSEPLMRRIRAKVFIGE